MSELHSRKVLILAEAELHRQIVSFECRRWQRRAAQVGQLARDQRSWIIGGAAILGIVIARRWRGLAAWLPTILTLARAGRRERPQAGGDEPAAAAES